MPEHLYEGRPISWLHEWWHTLLDTPQAALFIMTVLFAWGLWWMKMMFVTQKQLQAILDKNTKEHGVIDDQLNKVEKNVAWMRGRMELNHSKDKDKE